MHTFYVLCAFLIATALAIPDGETDNKEFVIINKLPNGCQYENETTLPENKYKAKFQSTDFNGWMNTGISRYSYRRFILGYANYYHVPTWKRVNQTKPNGKVNHYMRMGSEGLAGGDKVSLHTKYELAGCFCVHLDFRIPVPGDSLNVYAFRTRLAKMDKKQTEWKRLSVQVDREKQTMIRVVGIKGYNSVGAVEVDNLYMMKGMCGKPQYGR